MTSIRDSDAGELCPVGRILTVFATGLLTGEKPVVEYSEYYERKELGAMAEKFLAEEEFREEVSAVLDAVTTSEEPRFIMRNGIPVAVVMDVDHYNAMMDCIEKDNWEPTPKEAGMLKALMAQFAPPPEK